MADITILTGAGISAESGIPTFRDSNGLWENHNVEDVATPKGWMEDPQLVWRFYQERRRGMKGILPNNAHYALAILEQRLREEGHGFCLITQNIDGLHLLAGNENVVEMHGALRRFRCEKCDYEEESEYMEDELIPCPECGWVHLRPDVVWFDEMPLETMKFVKAVNECTHFASIGTSGEVYPAAGFIWDAFRDGKKIYFQNTVRAPAHLIVDKRNDVHEFIGLATSQVPKLCEQIITDLDI